MYLILSRIKSRILPLLIPDKQSYLTHYTHYPNLSHPILSSAGDPSCPLKELSVLVTPYNLWANIQVDPSPSSTLYDVLNADQWRPFFGARLPPPLGGLQSIQVLY